MRFLRERLRVSSRSRVRETLESALGLVRDSTCFTSYVTSSPLSGWRKEWSVVIISVSPSQRAVETSVCNAPAVQESVGPAVAGQRVAESGFRLHVIATNTGRSTSSKSGVWLIVKRTPQPLPMPESLRPGCQSRGGQVWFDFPGAGEIRLLFGLRDSRKEQHCGSENGKHRVRVSCSTPERAVWGWSFRRMSLQSCCRGGS